jgi:hypothetical protein
MRMFFSIKSKKREPAIFSCKATRKEKDEKLA